MTEKRRPTEDTGFHLYALDSTSVPPCMDKETPNADAASWREGSHIENKRQTRATQDTSEVCTFRDEM